MLHGTKENASSYEAAKARLTWYLEAELEPINRRAVRSFMDQPEETLSLQCPSGGDGRYRLGLFEELERSLKTTNCIENLNGQIERHLGTSSAGTTRRSVTDGWPWRFWRRSLACGA